MFIHKIDKKQEAEVLLTELLVLSIHYFRANSTSPLANDLFDQFKQIPKGNDQSQVVINVGALLFNLTRYQQSLDRFDAGLYEVLNDSENAKSIRAFGNGYPKKKVSIITKVGFIASHCAILKFYKT